MSNLTASYEAEIKEIQSAHDEKLASINVSQYRQLLQEERHQNGSQLAQKNIHEKQQIAANEAVSVARKELETKIQGLQQDRAKLCKKLKELRINVEEMVVRNKEAGQSAASETQLFHSHIEALKETHAQEVQGLQEQLKVGPNSWIEFRIERKSCRPRTYVRRPGERLLSVVEEYARSSNKKLEGLEFEHRDYKNKSRLITRGLFTKTLEQVSVMS